MTDQPPIHQPPALAPGSAASERPRRWRLHLPPLAVVVACVTPALGVAQAVPPPAPAPAAAIANPAHGSVVISIPLTSMRATELANALGPSSLEGVVIQADEAANAIAITAPTAETAARLERVVNALDRVGVEGEPIAAPLASTAPATVLGALDALLGPAGRLERAAIVDDPRGGVVLLRADPARRALILRAIAAIDGASPLEAPAPTRGEFAVDRVECTHAAARITALRALLPTRLAREVAALASPDARALILAGDAADLATCRRALGALESPDLSMRRVRLSSQEPMRVLEQMRAQLADAARGPANAATPALELDAASRDLVIMGTREEVDRALALLRRIEGGKAIERETAAMRVSRDAAQIASELGAILGGARRASDETPRVEALPTLGVVVVAGEPGTLAVAETALACIDVAAPQEIVARRLPVPLAGAAALVDRARAATAERLAARDQRAAQPTLALDAASGVVRVSGARVAVDLFEQALEELRGLRQPHRTARIVPVGARGADAIAAEISSTLGAPVPVDATRLVPAARVRALPSVRALFVEGEPAQIALLARLVHAREQEPDAQRVPMRLLELRSSDAPRVARAVEERFAARSDTERRARPVLAEGAAAGGALSIAVHPDLVSEVAAAVDAAEARADGASAKPREVFSSTLAQSDPLVVARALNGLFPTPAMPLDAFGHELPHLREPRELHATADAGARMVWVESARERAVALDALVALLDRLALAPNADVRLFRVEKGDITRVVQSLRDLAARGMLSRAAGDASAAGIVIDAEPMSRTLVVVGDATTFEKTEQVLRQLGLLASSSGVRVIDAAGVDPEQLRTRALRLAGLEVRAGEEALIGVSADAVRGLVKAVGDEAALERFAEACRRLAPRAGDAIAAVGSPDARAVGGADGRETSAFVGARREVERLDALAAALAASDGENVQPVRVAMSPCGDPAPIAEAVDAWYATRDEPERRARPVRIRASIDGDALLVVAPANALREVDGIVRDLGRAGVAGESEREVRIEPLDAQRAESVARLLGPSARAVPLAGGARRALLVEGDRTACALGSALAAAIAANPAPGALEARAWRLAAPGPAPAARAIGANALTFVEPDGETLVAVHAVDARAAVDAAVLGVDPRAVSIGSLRTIPLTTLAAERAATLLRGLLTGELAAADARTRSAPVVRVERDPASNTLLVAGPDQLCEFAHEIVARLDATQPAAGADRVRLRPPANAGVPNVAAEVATRSIALTSLEGARFAPILQGLLAEAQALDPRGVLGGGLGVGAQQAAPARVEADARGNLLVVTGTPGALLLAEELVAACERLDPLGESTAAVFLPTRADAAALASSAEVASAAAGRVRVAALARSGAILLSGAADAVAQVRATLAAIDSRTFVLPVVDGAQFAIRTASTAAVAEIVASVISDRARWPASIASAARAGMAVAEPKVVADVEGSRIVVAAAPELVAIAADVVARLDAERARGERWELRVYPIAPELVEGAVSAARQAIVARTPKGATPPRIDFDDIREGGALAVSGEPSWLDAVEAGIRSVDVRSPRDAARVRIVSLRNDDAVRLAPLLAPLLAPESGGDAGESQPHAEVEPEIRVLADARANAIALVATPTALDLAEEIVRDLDAPRDARADRSMRLYELRAGDAAVVAMAIADRFETDEGQDPLPTIRVHPSRNSLLVRATERQRATIESIIAKVDATAASRARFVRVIGVGPDPHSVDEVAGLTAELLDRGARVRMSTDRGGRTLVLFGDEDGVGRAMWIVGQAGNVSGPLDGRVRVRELPASADPRAIARLARAALGSLRLDLRVGDVVGASVVLGDRTEPRSIAYVASDRNARITDAVISLLVRGQAVEPFALRTVTLRNADAARVAMALREQAARADGTLIAVDDAAGRLVVLLGSPREVAEAARAAARLDRAGEVGPAPSEAEEVRLVPLRALSCAAAQALLAPIAEANGAPVLMAPERASNALVLRCEPTRLSKVCDFLARLDDPAAKDFAPFEVVRAKHLAPSALAQAVESAVSAADPARRDRVRLIADDATRLLFVRADAAILEDVRAAIAASDVPPPPPPPPASTPPDAPPAP